MLRGVYGFDGLLVMRESAATAARLETDPTSPWYALARGALGYSLYMAGEPEAAARPLEEAARNEAVAAADPHRGLRHAGPDRGGGRPPAPGL